MDRLALGGHPPGGDPTRGAAEGNGATHEDPAKTAPYTRACPSVRGCPR